MTCEYACGTGSAHRAGASSLVQVDGNGLFRYRPASPKLAETVCSVAELNAGKPLGVAKTIHANPTGKIETLADPFRFS